MFMISSNLENLPDLYGNAMKQELPESLPDITLDCNYDISEHASISKHKFLQKLKVAHTKRQSIEESTRKQRESM